MSSRAAHLEVDHCFGIGNVQRDAGQQRQIHATGAAATSRRGRRTKTTACVVRSDAANFVRAAVGITEMKNRTPGHFLDAGAAVLHFGDQMIVGEASGQVADRMRLK